MLKTRRRSRLYYPLALLLFAAALVGCGGGDENGGGNAGAGNGEGGQAGTIPLGYNVELSGPAAILGVSREVGANVAVEEINQEGGVQVDGESYELELVVEDNRTDPTAAVRASEAIANTEGVFWTKCPDQGFEPSYEILRSEGIICNADGGAPSNLLNENPEEHPLLFHEFITFHQYVDGHLRQLRYLYPEAETIAALLPNSANGQVFEEAWREFAPDHGFELVDVQVHPEDIEGDFSTFLTSMRGADPDIAYVGYLPPVTQPALEQAAQLDVAPVLNADLLVPEDVEGIDLSGHSVALTQHASAFSEQFAPEGTDELIQRFREEAAGDDILSTITVGAYVNIWVIKDAIERAGTIEDSEAIAEEYLNATYEGPFGPAEVLPNHAVEIALPVIQITEEGQVVGHMFESHEDEEPSQTTEGGGVSG